VPFWGQYRASATSACRQKNEPAGRIENNAICIRLSFDGAENLIALQIEDHYSAIATTVGNKSSSRFVFESNAMVSLLPRNITERLSRFGIDHHGMRAARDVEAVRLRIEGDVVPSAFTADVKGVLHCPLVLRSCKRA